ncbi:MAG: glycosyl transferase, family 2 [Mycobacterium sp.]|nr:glycosyl transferase, family 2 [Mycobacterium sp.]
MTAAVLPIAQAVVVIPAHNEAALLPRCLRATLTAATCLPVPVLTVVVLDSCDDGSAALAGQYGADVHFVRIDARSVGAARAAGFDYARSVCDSDDARTWYATTDADSQVDPDWLLRQTAADADMVLGVVRVPEWEHYPDAVAQHYLRSYQSDGPGHDHIHGANLGCRADAYWRVGGFATLESGEDVDLVERFDDAGYRIHWDERLSVATSDRQTSRAPGGFAAHLRSVSRRVLPKAAGEPA